MTTAQRLGFGLTIASILASTVNVATTSRMHRERPTVAQKQGDSQQGQTTTLLPDGRWLLLGGESSGGVSRSAAIVDPSTGTTTVLATSMTIARAGHSAALLPDGTVLISGGRDAVGQPVAGAELFDPSSGVFMPIAFAGSTARAGHSATLLTDGRVLVAGGTAGDRSVAQIEIWDVANQRVLGAGQLLTPRRGHSATLLGDGRVALTGGIDAAGAPVKQPEIFDPLTGRSTSDAPPMDDRTPARVSASVPSDGAVDVPVDARVAVRFSRPVRLTTVSARTVHLDGEEGPVDAQLVPAERGRLLFVTPRLSLRDDARYTLSFDGVLDVTGRPLVGSSLSFVTAKASDPAAHSPIDDEAWAPDAPSREHGWRTNRPPSPWESLPPLMAPPGVTAISGRVLTLDGRPLAGVSLGVEGDSEVQSDRTGRFLLPLKSMSTARRVLQIDGASASKPNRRYGFYEYGMAVKGGTTNVLPFTIWQPKLDMGHQVTFSSPTTSEVVVTTPYIPGLELHLPPGTTIRDEEGKPVTSVGITAIPVDRPPFPLAKNVEVPVYFTVQPGGAYVHTPGPGPKGAWLVYPNYTHLEPRQRVQFFHYDPDVNDWYVYGLGTANASQVVPDPTTRIYAFTGAMINGGGSPPVDGPPPGDCCSSDGDPVNLATGLFTLEATDLSLPDIIPIAITRTYRQRDTIARPFGVGMTHPYAMFLYDSGGAYQQADLILPDGGRIHYVRITPGGGWVEAVLSHQETASTAATPTAFYKSTMRWNGNGWDITLQDGTVYVFGENAPLQAIRDRYGNQVTILHASGQAGAVTQVISPNGRWIKFSYENGRISRVTDNIGRTVNYTYDAGGNLATVTDPEGHVTSYTYDSAHRMTTVKPPNLQGTQTNLVTNEYDTTGTPETNPTFGWVTKQTHADDGIFRFAYTFENGKIANTLVTDPRGKKRRVTFNGDGYSVADRRAVDELEEQGDTSDRPTRNNFVTSSTDTDGDVTTTDYDDLGRVRRVTRLPGTPDEAITTYTYDPVWTSEIATITDPLQHTTTFEYDERGNRKSIIDALGHKTAFTFNAAGQVTSVTDPLQHTTTYEYGGPDLVKITDPLGQVTRRFYDAGGRLLAETDPAAVTTRFVFDKLNHVTQVTDVLGGTTIYGYDTAGRLGSITDALNHTTTYGYDAFDRLASRTDPLSKAEAFTYDLDGRPAQRTDRKGQVTTRTYDALNRLHQVAYADNSTITYTYDSGNRLRTLEDSLSGPPITREYDNLDRLTSEMTAQGTISYTYDKADRRATMTVTGQLAVIYEYDEANRLTSVRQGSSTVTITYDDANRRSALTLPNGIVTSYGYDDANQLTSLTYARGQTTLGRLTYTYDAAGRRTEVGGTWARTGLPRALLSATYDAANRLTIWGGLTFSYDPNGNLSSDGPTSYTWNARDQLVGMRGGTAASFSYDAVGRRLGKTISGTATNFLYDGTDVVQELSGATSTVNLIRGLTVDELWSRTDGSGSHVTLADALGSMLAETDASGIVQTQFAYEPFGSTTQTGSSTTTAFEYTGREHDTDSVYFYRARFYSPVEGRFLSEDPIEFRGGLNLYTYVADSPPNLIDPTGECSCSVRVRCRPVDDWRARLASADHCYIVTKDRGGVYDTLSGGRDQQNPNILRVWNSPGDPAPGSGNSYQDRTIFFKEGNSLCDTVECLKRQVAAWDAPHLRYGATFGPNSNTFVGAATKACGLAVSPPVTAYGWYWR